MTDSLHVQDVKGSLRWLDEAMVEAFADLGSLVQRPDEDAGDALRSLAVVFERYTHLKRNIGTLLEDCTEADRPAHNA